MTTPRTRRPAAFWLLIALLALQGIAAVPAGLMLVLDPVGGMMLRMPADMLEGSPFDTFLIPGLILFLVLGVGAFFVMACLLALPDWGWTQRLNPFKGRHWTWAASAAFGVALMIWIVVQVLMIGGGDPLQTVFFVVGMAILLLTLSGPVRRYLALPASAGGRAGAPGVVAS
jgi:hypothetical protein